MAKQTFTTGQVLTAAQMTSLQQTAMGGGAPVTKTGSYVLAAADAGTVIQMNAAGSTTITVNTSLFSAGDTVQIQNIGVGVCTITAGTATVTTAGSLALSQWEGGFLYFTSASAAIFFDVVQSSGMTNPMTTTGDTIYSSSGSTPARLGIGSTGQVLTVAGGVPSWATPSSGTPTFVGVALKDTTQQTIANNTITVLTWDSEDFDTDAFHSTSSNTGRITIPAGKSGKYLLIGQTEFAANATGDRELYLRKNGSTIKTIYTPATATVFPILSFSAILDLTATDYVEMAVFQTSGGNLTAYKGTAGYGWFNAQYLGA